MAIDVYLELDGIDGESTDGGRRATRERFPLSNLGDVDASIANSCPGDCRALLGRLSRTPDFVSRWGIKVNAEDNERTTRLDTICAI